MDDLIKELKTDGLLLKKTRKKDQTIEMCRAAIRQNPRALQYASIKCIDHKICLDAVTKEGSVFRYVPSHLITEKMCKLAVSAVGSLLNNVPEKFRTDEICLVAIERDVSSLSYVSQHRIHELITENTPFNFVKRVVDYNKSWLAYMPVNECMIELCLGYIKEDFLVSLYFPEMIKQNSEILKYQKAAGKTTIIGKRYDSSSGKFTAVVKIECGTKPAVFDESKLKNVSYSVEVEFQGFNEFYTFLDGDLANAELRTYNFEGVDLKKYNIEGAVIHSSVLCSQGLYDGEFYEALSRRTHISDNQDTAKYEISVQTDFCYPKPVDTDGHEQFDYKHIPFFYISDVHLCHRIINHFNGKATKEEIFSYVRFLTKKMIASIGTVPHFSYLLIAGDTSSDFEIAQEFYKELLRYWNAKRIIVISGNHELWDPYLELEENIQAYQTYFVGLGITYLHNSVLFVKDLGSNIVVQENQLLALDEEKLRDLALYSSIIILGGVGFSGLNENYNAVYMRYGKSFEEYSPEVARKKDIQESDRFNTIYKKLLAAIQKNRVIVLTHMKKDDWNAVVHNPKWIYINGHNHRNFYEASDRRVIYADNQIGYKSNNVGLKYFYIDNEYDIFAYYKDGIHEISMEQYSDFNRGKMIMMSYGKKDGNIYMIKKNGIYMFLVYCFYYKQSKTKCLYLLNGGKLCKLIGNSLEDIPYYLDVVEKYVENVYLLLDRYSGGQKRISEFVKKLGGSGKIHGCIVDVEKPNEMDNFSYYHLFVNPTDGKVTPYFAYDVKSRIVYKDIKSMLESNDKCKLLADNYVRLESESKSNLPAVQYLGQVAFRKNESFMYDEGSYLYKISRIIKSLQYITEKNVIRIWNEELLNHYFVNRINQANTIEDMVDGTLLIDMEQE